MRKKAEEKKNISTSEKGRITRFTDFNLHFVHNSIERFSSLLSFYFFQRRHSSSILMFDLKKAEKKYIGDEKVIFFRSQHPIHFHFFTHSENVKYHFPIFFPRNFFLSFFFWRTFFRQAFFRLLLVNSSAFQRRTFYWQTVFTQLIPACHASSTISSFSLIRIPLHPLPYFLQPHMAIPLTRPFYFPYFCVICLSPVLNIFSFAISSIFCVHTMLTLRQSPIFIGV